MSCTRNQYLGLITESTNLLRELSSVVAEYTGGEGDANTRGGLLCWTSGQHDGRYCFSQETILDQWLLPLFLEGDKRQFVLQVDTIQTGTTEQIDLQTSLNTVKGYSLDLFQSKDISFRFMDNNRNLLFKFEVQSGLGDDPIIYFFFDSVISPRITSVMPEEKAGSLQHLIELIQTYPSSCPPDFWLHEGEIELDPADEDLKNALFKYQFSKVWQQGDYESLYDRLIKSILLHFSRHCTARFQVECQFVLRGHDAYSAYSAYYLRSEDILNDWFKTKFDGVVSWGVSRVFTAEMQRAFDARFKLSLPAVFPGPVKFAFSMPKNSEFSIITKCIFQFSPDAKRNAKWQPHNNNNNNNSNGNATYLEHGDHNSHNSNGDTKYQQNNHTNNNNNTNNNTNVLE